MAKFTIGEHEFGEVLQSNFEEFISIVKGRSIVSAADWGEERFELGLSGDLMVRFFKTDDGTAINLISTRNPDENPSLVIVLGDMPQKIPISVIERKLHGLRTLYAIFYLIYDERARELESYLIRHPQGDVERALLTVEEQIYIESISYGSWILTVWAKTKKAYRAISSVAGLAFERSREAFFRKTEAEARLIEAQADKQEIENLRERFNLKRDQFDYLLEAIQQMEIPEIREQLKSRIIQATKNLTLGDQSNAKSHRLLE